MPEACLSVDMSKMSRPIIPSEMKEWAEDNVMNTYEMAPSEIPYQSNLNAKASTHGKSLLEKRSIGVYE